MRGNMGGRSWRQLPDRRRGLRARSEILLSVLSVLSVLSTLVVAGPGFAHEDPMLIPDGADPIVRWYQPPGSVPVLDWDVEITPYGSVGEPLVMPAQAYSDPSCWAIDVETQDPVRVRVRAVQDDAVSAWSDYTVVPEPALGLTLAVAVPLMALSARRRSGMR